MLSDGLTGPLKGGGGETALRGGETQSGNEAVPLRWQTKRFVLFILGLSACFARPLFALGQYSMHDQYSSYIPLIPVISLYLIWLKKPELPRQSGMSWKWGAAAALGGFALLIAYQWEAHSGWRPQPEDYLSLMTASFYLFLVAGCLTFLGGAISQSIAFPIAFLAFMVPMPSAMFYWTMSFFQRTSAVAAHGFLAAAGMPVFREGTTFHLPGFTLRLGPECSGIHSTLVFLINAVLASYLFLRSGWKRALLVMVVFPLAILRNGFRVFVIAEMCVHISHDMIDSSVHRRGGSLFFALSFIPFFALLMLLRKYDLHGSKSIDAPATV
jgi:exosortase C (VPDSG-CTERM-specific)